MRLCNGDMEIFWRNSEKIIRLCRLTEVVKIMSENFSDQLNKHNFDDRLKFNYKR